MSAPIDVPQNINIHVQHTEHVVEPPRMQAGNNSSFKTSLGLENKPHKEKEKQEKKQREKDKIEISNKVKDEENSADNKSDEEFLRSESSSDQVQGIGRRIDLSI